MTKVTDTNNGPTVKMTGSSSLIARGIYGNIYGKSLDNLHSLIANLATFDYNILFSGERGSGKELFADIYIKQSHRKDKFEKINCAGFDDNLLRSELFGHKKGSFTGADEKKIGLFEKVNKGGGIFLDELGDAS